MPGASHWRGRVEGILEKSDGTCRFNAFIQRFQSARPVHPVKCPPDGHEMQAAKPGTEVVGAAEHEVNCLAGLCGISSGGSEHFRFGVDGDDLPGERMEIQRQEARPGAEVEHGPRSVQANQTSNPVGEEPRVRRSAGGVVVGDAAEASREQHIGH